MSDVADEVKRFEATQVHRDQPQEGFTITREEALRFTREADTVLTVNERSKMLELTTSWKEEGRLEGRKEECHRLVMRLLNRRFGPIGLSLEEQLKGLPLEHLETLAEAILDFATIGDLTEWRKVSWLFAAPRTSAR